MNFWVVYGILWSIYEAIKRVILLPYSVEISVVILKEAKCLHKYEICLFCFSSFWFVNRYCVFLIICIILYLILLIIFLRINYSIFKYLISKLLLIDYFF